MYCTTGKEWQNGLQMYKAILIFYIMVSFSFESKLFLGRGGYYMDVFCWGEKNSLLFLSYFIIWCYSVQHLLWTCLLYPGV